MLSAALFIIAFATLTSARTDLSGCVSSETLAYGGASLLWYVPGTGEICNFLDCGGGRAPPKTTVPGCPSYEGTGTYSPSFIALATSTTAAASSSTSPSSAMITGSQTTAEASNPTSEVTSSLPDAQSSSDVSSSASGLITTTTPISNSSATGAGSGSFNPSSTGTAAIGTATGNAAAINSFSGLVGVVVAGFTFLM